MPEKLHAFRLLVLEDHPPFQDEAIGAIESAAFQKFLQDNAIPVDGNTICAANGGDLAVALLQAHHENAAFTVAVVDMHIGRTSEEAEWGLDLLEPIVIAFPNIRVIIRSNPEDSWKLLNLAAIALYPNIVAWLDKSYPSPAPLTDALRDVALGHSTVRHEIRDINPDSGDFYLNLEGSRSRLLRAMPKPDHWAYMCALASEPHTAQGVAATMEQLLGRAPALKINDELAERVAHQLEAIHVELPGAVPVQIPDRRAWTIGATALVNRYSRAFAEGTGRDAMFAAMQKLWVKK